CAASSARMSARESKRCRFSLSTGEGKKAIGPRTKRAALALSAWLFALGAFAFRLAPGLFILSFTIRNQRSDQIQQISIWLCGRGETSYFFRVSNQSDVR